MKKRIHFLDNLRTFLIFLVILIHAGLVYERVLETNWLVIDPLKNNSIGLIRMYVDIFVMFIMFFISGYFIPDTVKEMDSFDFVKSKFNRIMVPWIVAVFTLIPAYKVIFLFSRGLPQEEWYSYFHFFQRTDADLSFFANNPSQHWLWFLPVLFLFQIMYLALSKTKLLSLNITLKLAVFLVFSVGLLYSAIISFIGLKGWVLTPLLDFQRERFLVYLLVFLLGSLCYKLKVFESTVKSRKYYIISNVVLAFSLTFFTIIALNLFFNMVDVNRNYYFVSEQIDRLMYYSLLLMSMLSFLHILIHVFRSNFNKDYRIMNELNKNSYQVYIIHMIVLGVIAMAMVYLPIPAFVKYLILTILTFIVSNLIISAYHRLFKSSISLKLVALTISVVALFSFISYGNENASISEKEQATHSQEIQVLPNISLHTAAAQGDIEAVRQYIEAGSDLDEREPAGGSSPLITATVFGKTEVAVLLIEAGADVNFKNNEGSTPVHTAAFFCQTEILEALLTNGADKEIKNNAGSTALESVTPPFEAVRGIYDYFGEILAPMGLVLDYEMIKKTRPMIATILQ